MRTKSIIIDRDTTDITTDDEKWRELLGGLSSRGQFSGACIFKDDVAINIIENLASSGLKDAFRIKFDSGDTLDGDFLVQNYEYIGDFGDAQMCNLTLMGDELTLTRLPAAPTDLWIAVGGNNLILTSTDGITWTVRTSPLGGSTRFNAVSYNGTDLWVAVTQAGEILTSPDGITWTEQTFAGLIARNVRYSNNLWVIASDNDAYTSTDGETWTLRILPITQQDKPTYGLAYNGSNLWIIFMGGFHRHTSADGITWSNHINIGAGGMGSVSALDHDKSSLWIVASIGKGIKTSSDGTTWTTQHTANEAINGIAFGNNLWATVGDNGEILTSPTGSTWSSRTSGTTRNLIGIESNQSDLWVAVGGDSTNRIILTSPDGITWTERLSATGVTPLRAVSINQVV